jgi:hypothetical protein
MVYSCAAYVRGEIPAFCTWVRRGVREVPAARCASRSAMWWNDTKRNESSRVELGRVGADRLGCSIISAAPCPQPDVHSLLPCVYAGVSILLFLRACGYTPPCIPTRLTCVGAVRTSSSSTARKDCIRLRLCSIYGGRCFCWWIAWANVGWLTDAGFESVVRAEFEGEYTELGRIFADHAGNMQCFELAEWFHRCTSSHGKVCALDE